MALGGVLRVRNFLFILMAGLCVSKIANEQHKKLSVANKRHFPGNFRLHEKLETSILEVYF